VFVNNQHGIQRRGKDCDKQFVSEGVLSNKVDRRISVKCDTQFVNSTYIILFLINIKHWRKQLCIHMLKYFKYAGLLTWHYKQHIAEYDFKILSAFLLQYSYTQSPQHKAK